METYLTEKPISAGENIEANSFEEANNKAEELGLKVVGVLESEHFKTPCNRCAVHWQRNRIYLRILEWMLLQYFRLMQSYANATRFLGLYRIPICHRRHY